MDSRTMPTVRLRVTITIDIDAEDYLEAAEHQKKLEVYLASVRDEYPSAGISVRERRGPRAEEPRPPRLVRVHSGKLNAYE